MENLSEGGDFIAPKPHRRSLRITLWIVGILLLLIAILASLPFVFTLFFHDSPTVDDSDILLTHVDVPLPQNGFYDFLAIKKVDESGYVANQIFSEENMSHFTEQDFAKNIFEGDVNSEVLRHWSDAAQKQFFQDPVVAVPENFTPDTPPSNYSVLRSASRLSSTKAMYLGFIGKEKEAFDEAFKGIVIAERMQNSQISFIGYLVAMAIKENSLTAVDRIVASTTLTIAELKPYIEMLSEMKEGGDGLALAFRYEYLPLKYFMRSGQFAQDLGHAIGKIPAKLLLHSIYFQPNNTLALYGDNTRREVRESLAPCRTAPSSFVLRFPLGVNSLFESNSMGKFMFMINSASLSTATEKRCSGVSHLRATELLMAVRAYKNDHGILPASLNELAPSYLTEIPVDPFSGKPMMYDAKNKVIYSVGVNRKDDGGVSGVNANSWDSTDRVFPFAF